MARVQLALNVGRLDEAVDFYSRLFGVAPAKVRPGYANFTVVDPPLKLVLIENVEAPAGSLNHLGIEVDTAKQITVAGARLAPEGLPTATENGVDCCYAIQDKVWVDGPGGESWEIYTVLADADASEGAPPSADPSGAACCAGGPGLPSTVPAPPSSYCRQPPRGAGP